MKTFKKPWSHSALTLYETCPKAYALQKIHGYQANEHTERGNKIHEEIEKYIQNKGPYPKIEMPRASFWQMQNDWARNELHTEYKIAINNKRNNVNFNSKSSWLRLIIDALKPSTNELWDFKTGKEYPVKHRLQLLLYAWALGLKEATGHLWYVDLNVMKTVIIKPEDLKRFETRLYSRLLPYEIDNEYIATPDPYKCPYCSFNQFCDEAMEKL